METISGDLKEQKWSEKNVLKATAFILFCSYFSSGYERLVCFINCNCCVSKALSANTGMLFGLFLTITFLLACAASVKTLLRGISEIAIPTEDSIKTASKHYIYRVLGLEKRQPDK